MGLKKTSSAPSYLDLFRPLATETWMMDGNCHESKRPDHMARYWTTNRRHNADQRGLTDEEYGMALALCEVCPSQWACIRFSMRNQDGKFNIWAVSPEDRKILRRRRDWEQIVDTAERHGRSVASIVVTIPIVAGLTWVMSR